MGAVLGWGRVAYGAHLGGFFGGLALAFIFLKFKLVEFQRADNKHLFHKIFGSFVVDEVNRSMLNYLQSLGKKEVRVKIGDLNEQSVPADLLRRMIQAKQVKGVDQIYCQREGEWDLISRYLNKKVIEAKSEGIDFNDFPDDINHSSSDQEIISSLKANILSWNEEKFYLHRGEQTFGPYSARLLAEYLEQNRVAKDDLIFDKKNQQWQPLKEVFSKAKIN
jgi:hypothetical protein